MISIELQIPRMHLISLINLFVSAYSTSNGQKVGWACEGADDSAFESMAYFDCEMVCLDIAQINLLQLHHFSLLHQFAVQNRP